MSDAMYDLIYLATALADITMAACVAAVSIFYIINNRR